LPKSFGSLVFSFSLFDRDFLFSQLSFGAGNRSSSRGQRSVQVFVVELGQQLTFFDLVAFFKKDLIDSA
jgi:hypothetical protein